jgi:predicted  nucleic acid-binding Zn-ribbon protein
VISVALVPLSLLLSYIVALCRSAERIADAAEDAAHNINQRGLLQKLQKLEEDLECANQRANSANLKLNDADVTISNLQASVSRLQEEVRNLKEKNLEYVTEKIEAEAGEQLKEAAISVLRLRIFALEGDLQQERHTKGGNSSLNPKNKSLTQLSPDIDVEIKTRAGLVFKRDANHHVDSKAGKQDTAKYQLHQDAGTLGSLRKVNGALKTDFQRERAHTACTQNLSSDAWSVKKMKKLEQALVEARERYTSLWRGTLLSSSYWTCF